MRKPVRRVFWIIFTGSLLLLLSVYVLVSHTSLPARGLTRIINRTLPESLGLEVSVGEVRGDLFNGLDLADITVSFLRDDEKKRVMNVREVKMRYHLGDLIAGRAVFSDITLIEPAIDLDDGALRRLLGRSQADSSRSEDRSGVLDFGVGHVQMRNGRFAYRGASGKRVTVEKIQLTGDVRGSGRTIFAAVESGSFSWIEGRLHVEQFGFEAAFVDDSLTISRVNVVTANSSVHGRGAIRELHSPELDVHLAECTVALEEIGVIVGLPERQLMGIVGLNGALTGPLTRLRVQTELEGTFNGFTFDRLWADMTVSNGTLKFKEFSLHSARARISGSGQLTVRGGCSYEAKMSCEHVDLSTLPGVTLRTDLTCSILLAGRGFSRDSLDISAELGVGRSHFNHVSIDSCAGCCRLLPGSISTEGPLTLWSGGVRAVLRGETRFDGSADIQSDLHVEDLKAVTEALHLPVHRGQARGSIAVSGPMSDPDIDGTVTIDSLANSTYRLATCVSTLHLESVVRNRRGSITIHAQGGRVGNVPIEKLDTHLSLRGSSLQIDSLFAANSEASVEARGTLHADEDVKRLSLTRLEAQFREYDIASTDTAYLSFGKGGAIRAGGRFRAGDGDLRLFGSVAPDRGIKGDVVLRSVNLLPLVETMHLTEKIEGVADGRITVRGSLEAPRSALRMAIRRGRVATLPFDTLRCTANYGSERLDITALELFKADSAILSCRGSIPLRCSLSGGRPASLLTEDSVSFSVNLVDFHLLSLSRLTPSRRQYTGVCSAEMRLSRTLKDPAVSLDVFVRGAQYDVLHFGDLRAGFHYDGGLLRVLFLEASHEGTEYASTGVIPVNLSWPLTDSFLFGERMDVNFGMAGGVPDSLIALLTDKVEHLSGTVDCRLALGGTFAQPVLNGDLSLKGGKLRLSDLENPMADVELEMTVADTLLTIERCVGKMGKGEIESGGFFDALLRLVTFRKRGDGGRLSLQGTVNFADVDRIQYDLTCAGEAVFLRPSRKGIDLIVDADLRLLGTDPHLSGDVIVTQGLVREALKPRETIEAEPAPSGSNGFGPSVDLNVHIPSNFWIEGSDYLQELSVELRGDIQVVRARTGPEFQFFGTAETMRGKYHIYGNLFRITQGTISFGGVSEMNPSLNIDAETRVGTEPIYLNLSGTLLQPEVKLWSQSGYSEKDIITLLTLGTTTTAVDTVGVSGAFESKATNVLGSLIEGELARRARQGLGVDTFEITSGGGSQLVPDKTEVTVGKYLSERVYLEYSRRLAAESEQEVELQYRLNRHLSFLGARDRRGLYHLQLQLKFDY